MVVARACLRPRLWPFTAPNPLAFAAEFRAGFASTAYNRRWSKRAIPDQCKAYYSPNGQLHTTQANADFLRETGIAYDNDIASTGRIEPKIKSLFTGLGVNIRFTPRHLISPYDLFFLDPRGHSLASLKREKYAERTATEPLWLITTSNNSTKAVVYHTVLKRMRASLYMALEARGYDRYGRGARKEVRGTLWMFVRDPMKSVNSLNMKEFGNALVDFIEANQGRGRRS